MNTPYFLDRLESLYETTFQGFAPRWFLPGTKLYSTLPDHTQVSQTQTLAIIDTASEIKIGVGYDWYPEVLGPSEIQIPEVLLSYFQKDIGDTVTFNANFTKFIAD
jgi:hypothetical protein